MSASDSCWLKSFSQSGEELCGLVLKFSVPKSFGSIGHK